MPYRSPGPYILDNVYLFFITLLTSTLKPHLLVVTLTATSMVPATVDVKSKIGAYRSVNLNLSILMPLKMIICNVELNKTHI